MDSTTHLQTPVASHQLRGSEEQVNGKSLAVQNSQHDADYDPCQNAQKFSPFYMYNHDSPRPSADGRPKQSIHVDVRDLELGEITPSVTQEKIAIQKKPRNKFKFWERKQDCLTKPKKQFWLQRLPKKQRIAVKLLIALLIIGTMVGIAVGIASALNSGVNGSSKKVGHPDDQSS